MKWLVHSLVGLTAFAICPATQAAEPEELFDDLIHSDVPLWGFEHKELWPRHFSDEDGSFGCSSRVGFGDWQISYGAPDTDDRWTRLSSYGVFHCALIEKQSYSRETLTDARYEYGFAVKIGNTQAGGRRLELWVLQSGLRTGSDYTLLAREPGGGVIEQFSVLQRKCPPGRTRKGPNLDIWKVTYCGINKQAQIVDLAKRMARLPPLATMRRIGEALEKPAEAEKQN